MPQSPSSSETRSTLAIAQRCALCLILLFAVAGHSRGRKAATAKNWKKTINEVVLSLTSSAVSPPVACW